MDDYESAAMAKLIRVTVLPERRDAYLQSQQVWNRESRLATGYLGELVGEGEEGKIHIITFWRSRAEYEQWMERDHDRIASLADSGSHYESLETLTIDLLPT